jgi:hypothetical protein
VNTRSDAIIDWGDNGPNTLPNVRNNLRIMFTSGAAGFHPNSPIELEIARFTSAGNMGI